jgi:hypothetical protein
VKVGKAILAGIIGGLAMTALAWLARATGIDLNGEMMLGTMTGNAPGPGTWTVGLMMHLVLSALIALLYAAGFERVTRRAGAGIGLGFSLAHHHRGCRYGDDPGRAPDDPGADACTRSVSHEHGTDHRRSLRRRASHVWHHRGRALRSRAASGGTADDCPAEWVTRGITDCGRPESE